MTVLFLLVLGWVIWKLKSLEERVIDFEDDAFEELAEIKSHPIFLARAKVLTGQLTRGTSKSACWDIYSQVDALVVPGGQVVLATGLTTEMHYCDALCLDRSGLAAKFEISRRAGVIDEDYAFEWKVILRNEGKEAYQVKAGDRVSQVYFLPKFNVPVEGGVSEDTIRSGGLGSTGK